MILRASFLSFILLSAVAFAQGPVAPATSVGPRDIRIDKILPGVVKTPEYSISGGPQKRSRSQDWLEVEVEFSTAPELIDELTVKYSIAVAGALLTGEVTHVNIAVGKEHYSVVYVSPKSLARLLGNKPLTSAAIQNAWVQITRQGQVLAEQGLRPGPIPNLPQIAGFVLTKPETPFAPLFWDRYEAIKPAR